MTARGWIKAALAAAALLLCAVLREPSRCCIVLGIFAAGLLAENLISELRYRRRLDRLIGYITRVQDDLSLAPPECASEGQLDILQSEIYKVVALLREQYSGERRQKEYLSDMLSDISHQIKTPLTAIQLMTELLEHPDLDAEMEAFIAKERKELSGSFCRSCGYCMPCPMGIEIRNCARMNMLLRRSPWQQYMTDEWYAKMHKIEDCIECRSCASKCPYQLDTPNLLKYMLKDYDEFYASHKDLV